MPRMSAAPTPVILSDGKEYLFHPLSDRDLDELDEWLRSRVISLLRDSVKGIGNQAERQEFLQAGISSSIFVNRNSSAGLQLLNTIPGIARLAWLSARKSVKFDYQHFLDLCYESAENIDTINDAFKRLNFSEMPKDGESDNEKK